MAERNEEVFERVREELVKRPNLSTGVLYEMARRMDPAIGEQNLQQFHTRYVVPVTHELASVQRRRKRARSARKTKKRETAAAQQRRAATAPPPVEVPPVEVPPPATGAAQPRAAERLPVTRRRSAVPPAAQPERGRRARDGEGERTRIRAVLLQFAREVAAAESRGEVVQVLSTLDRFVDQVMAQRR